MQDPVYVCNMLCLYHGLVCNVVYRTVHLMICGIYYSGWMQNLQERASEWDDWDELVDRGSLLIIENGVILSRACMICFVSYRFACVYIQESKLLDYFESKALPFQDLFVIHLRAVDLIDSLLLPCFEDFSQMLIYTFGRFFCGPRCNG